MGLWFDATHSVDHVQPDTMSDFVLRLRAQQEAERNNRAVRAEQARRLSNEEAISARREARDAELERKQKLKERMEEAKRRGLATQNLAKLLSQGRTSEAGLLARSEQFEDPSTGDLRGIDMRVDTQDVPGYDDSTQQAVTQAARPDAMRLRSPTLERGPQDENGVEAPSAPGMQLRAPDVTTRAIQQQRAMFRFPDQKDEVSYDLNEMRDNASKEAQQQSARLLDAAAQARAMGDEVRAKQYEVAANQVQYQLRGDKVQMAEKVAGREDQQAHEMAKQDDAQDFQGEQRSIYNLTAEDQKGLKNRQLDIAATRAAKTGKNGGSPNTGKDGFNSKIDTAARASMNAYLTQQGFKGTAQQAENIGRLSTMATSKTGLGDATVAAGFVRLVQGSGVLSDADMDQFWNNAGSAGDRTEGFFTRVFSGTMPEEKRRQAIDALRVLGEKANARMSSLYEGAVPIMTRYGDYGNGWVKGYFGRDLPGMGQPQAPAPGSAPAPGARQLSPKAQAILDKYKNQVTP